MTIPVQILGGHKLSLLSTTYLGLESLGLMINVCCKLIFNLFWKKKKLDTATRIQRQYQLPQIKIHHNNKNLKLSIYIVVWVFVCKCNEDVML